MSRRVADPQPIAAINITPLIDVMLVLLIMMILTLPTVTHEVPVSLPAPGPVVPTVAHRLDIAASGALMLDGVAVSEAALPDRLAAIHADPHATLALNADADARYEAFDRILATIKRAGVTRLGFVGLERFVPAVR